MQDTQKQNKLKQTNEQTNKQAKWNDKREIDLVIHTHGMCSVKSLLSLNGNILSIYAHIYHVGSC